MAAGRGRSFRGGIDGDVVFLLCWLSRTHSANGFAKTCVEAAESVMNKFAG